jgi:tyrosyl-tRNA synthetase
MLVASGLVASRSEGRRAIEQGGVTVNEEKITDIKASYAMDQLGGEGVLVKRGKKNYKKIVLKK